jgi:hypothetical protein
LPATESQFRLDGREVPESGMRVSVRLERAYVSVVSSLLGTSSDQYFTTRYQIPNVASTNHGYAMTYTMTNTASANGATRTRMVPMMSTVSPIMVRSSFPGQLGLDRRVVVGVAPELVEVVVVGGGELGGLEVGAPARDGGAADLLQGDEVGGEVVESGGERGVEAAASVGDVEGQDPEHGVSLRVLAFTLGEERDVR